MILAMTADPATADAAIASVEEQFGIMFAGVKARMRDRARQVHPGLQPVGYTILTTLTRSGPTHAGALAEMLDTDKSSISRQARALEELGLLEREADPTDGRATFLKASADAVRRVTQVRAEHQALLYEGLRGWEVSDLEQLSELLARINTLNS